MRNGQAAFAYIKPSVRTLDRDLAALEWQAFMDDVRQTLDKFQVPPQPEWQEPIAIVESTKEAIVVSPFQEGLAATTAGEDRS